MLQEVSMLPMFVEQHDAELKNLKQQQAQLSEQNELNYDKRLVSQYDLDKLNSQILKKKEQLQTITKLKEIIKEADESILAKMLDKTDPKIRAEYCENLY